MDIKKQNKCSSKVEQTQNKKKKKPKAATHQCKRLLSLFLPALFYRSLTHFLISFSHTASPSST